MAFNWKRSGLLYTVILLGAVAIAFVLLSPPQGPAEVPLTEVIEMSQGNNIEKVVEEGEWLIITTRNNNEIKTYIGMLNYNDLRELGFSTDLEYEIKPGGMNWGNIVIGFLPLLLFGGLLFFIFFRARGANNQALNFGRSRARLAPADKPTVTFDDVAGIDEAKQELHEVVEFLKSREKFQVLGARIPRGVLLIGPPGTGKTLLARAIAGEAEVPFFSISGSEFVEMFVGVGASRVRDLFDQAKRQTPCIIFVDEIDAVGRQRGAGLGGSHDEREQTLNQILTEMDGFDTNTSVIVLAATNRPDILDPALLRPGRFDRRVVLDRPDIAGRAAILKVHCKDKLVDEAVDLDMVAKQTVGFSGADLANLVNEAAILAARRGKKTVEMEDLEESIDKVLLGPERKSHRVSAKEKEITAYHEAGHALVAHMLPGIEPVRKISIIPRGMAGGYTKMLTEDREYAMRSYIKETLAMAMGGRAAEELIFGEITTGAQSDIKQATNLARRMVTEYGMSEKLGPRTFGDKQEMVFLGREISEHRDYSERTANAIDGEVDSIIKEAHEKAKVLLVENKPKLIELAQKLIAEETLEGEALDTLFGEPAAPRKRKVKPTTTPVPIEVKAETAKSGSKAKKAAIIPNPLPNQAPAPSD
ncbi:MAG: ATP-dependent zinc metalloprotease FtsH [Dehalococcoidales bacterium]|jgi:cell division protease FtsH|nr:ATP-dependent zinc metalloprotease FtsH [Dehalococcoidales bacterium]